MAPDPPLEAARAARHRLVDAQGAGPPRRWWRRRRGDPPQTRCTFCGRAGTEVGRLVAGPGVYICDGCVGLATAVATDRKPPGDDRVHLRYLDGDLPRDTGSAKQGTGCRFCGKSHAQSAALVGTSAASICDACLRLCREIVAEVSAGR
jgi:hypothetical protein